MKKLFKNFLLLFIGFIVIMGLLSNYNVNRAKDRTIDIKTLIQEINSDNVENIDVVGATKLDITLKDGEKKIANKEPNESLSTLFKNYDVDPSKTQNIIGQIKEDNSFSFWVGATLPIILPVILIFIFLFFVLRQVQGANNKAMMFGQSRAREVKLDLKNKITFKDVAGAREAKEELEEIVEFLKNPKKFTDLGAKIPKGVLLMGSPGTGKTLLAKAVAGEAEVPFFSISGSEFVEMFVGVGASRVRDLFTKAKKAAPCIIFIDEIDAVGRQRGAGLGGSHDEREQTLNQILVEMDGFEPHTNVIVVAATNRPDVLDPALLRPGRFDRRVTIDRPDIRDREAILKVHAKKKPLAEKTDLRKVAARTPGFSGADLANLLNEAAIFTARKNEKIIKEEYILESIDKVLIGPARKSHVMSEREKKITAYHEAGHALVGHELPNCDPVHKVSIISRGPAAGYTLNLPDNDEYLNTRAKFTEDIAMMLGGHVAEKIIFGDVTSGASSDLQKVSQLAKRLVTQYGMAENLPPRAYGQREDMIFLGREIHEKRDFSEKTAEKIDAEIEKIVKEAFEKATSIINSKRDKLEAIVEALYEVETIEREQFEKIMKGEKITSTEKNEENKNNKK